MLGILWTDDAKTDEALTRIETIETTSIRKKQLNYVGYVTRKESLENLMFPKKYSKNSKNKSK